MCGHCTGCVDTVGMGCVDTVGVGCVDTVGTGCMDSVGTGCMDIVRLSVLGTQYGCRYWVDSGHSTGVGVPGGQ